MKTPRVLLALENEPLRQDITYLLSQSTAAAHISEEDPGNWKDVLNRINRERPEVLLVELNAIRNDLTNALRAVKKAAGHTQIIGLHPTDDPQLFWPHSGRALTSLFIPHLTRRLSQRSKESSKPRMRSGCPKSAGK